MKAQAVRSKSAPFADNRYYASVSFRRKQEIFNILLGQDGDKSISLTAEGGKVFFKNGWS